MKRLLGGFAAALTLTICLATPARSAEIPPTAECVAAVQELIDRYNSEIPTNPTESQLKRAERRFAERLAVAGCVSDFEPLLRQTPAKPFTEQCTEAAARAQAFVGPETARLKRLTRKFNRQVKRPFLMRQRILENRRAEFKARDKPRRVAAINRKLERLRTAYRVKSHAYAKRIVPSFKDNAYAYYLTLAELRSLLCVNYDNPLEKGKGPGQLFAWRNGQLLFFSLFYITLENYADDKSSSSAASGLQPYNLSSGMAARLSLPGLD